MAEHWYDTTALDDLLGVDTAAVNDTRLYRALDKLGEHKDALCAHLMERYRQWFGVRFEFLLYDVTSTYFEGEAERNPQAQRGYSRDQRPGNKQVCIGLVCTPEGLPLSFEVFAGNRADVGTVEQIVRGMEEKYGQAERIWVMDRGMVSEANIAFLRERKARYLVGTPKSCFLALALWRSLEQWMHAKGLGTCARQLVKEVATIKSVDVILPVLRGGVRTQLRLRVVATPEPATAQLLAHLGLRLPKGPRIVADVVPKIAP